MVPIVTPLATRPEGSWKARAAGLVKAATVGVVAIEVAYLLVGVLLYATILEDPLARACAQTR